MEAALVLVIVVIGVIVVSKMKKIPTAPKEMSDEALATRSETERNWIAHYQALPLREREGTRLKREYGQRQLLLQELQSEMVARQAQKQPAR